LSKQQNKVYMSYRVPTPNTNFDLETTGTNVLTDRIVQIALVYTNSIGMRDTRNILINPGIPIPVDATDVHGITDEMVKDASTFPEIANDIFQYMVDVTLIGFNIKNFDIPLLKEEFKRCGIDWDVPKDIIDVFQMDKALYRRTLNNVYKQHTGLDIDGAHDALNDVYAVDVILQSMVKYNNTEVQNFLTTSKDQVDIAGKFLLDEVGNIVFGFGKFQGNQVSKHIQYVQWMNQQEFFTADTKDFCKKILAGAFRVEQLTNKPAEVVDEAKEKILRDLENAEVDPFA